MDTKTLLLTRPLLPMDFSCITGIETIEPSAIIVLVVLIGLKSKESAMALVIKVFVAPVSKSISKVLLPLKVISTMGMPRFLDLIGIEKN